MAEKLIKVKSFVRKDGVRVKSFLRRKPKLSEEERRRRARFAREKLLPLAIKAAGKKGFRKTKEALEGKPGIETPEKLAGWLKGQAKKMGVLSPEHPYVGRKGYRKYPEMAKKLSPEAYRAYLRMKRNFLKK